MIKNLYLKPFNFALVKVERFQVLLCIMNLLFIDIYYYQLIDQIVLFQRIQFSMSYLFILSLNIKQFYVTHI